MTAQILASELGNLIQESKRKHSDLRNVSEAYAALLHLFPFALANRTIQAAERSLDELKSLRSTSEAQIAAGEFSHKFSKQLD